MLYIYILWYRLINVHIFSNVFVNGVSYAAEIFEEFYAKQNLNSNMYQVQWENSKRTE